MNIIKGLSLNETAPLNFVKKLLFNTQKNGRVAGADIAGLQVSV